LLLFLAACRTPDDPPAAASETGSPADDTAPTDLTGACTTPDVDPAAPECTNRAADWLVMCDWPGEPDREASWTGRFTSFSGEDAVHFEPTDGSLGPMLVTFGSVGSWRRVPDLVGAGEVTLHALGGCGESFEGPWLTVVTDTGGRTLLVVGQTDRGSLAGWSVAPGAGAGSCPMYVAAPPACQACQSNQPLRVTGPGFDATAWQSEVVTVGDLELQVGSAWEGSGLLCEGQTVDLYNWLVGPPAAPWTGP
jgi:hypothetical protein